jgi:2-desacetyl-2-hydroxyethyl bacteriochlorophyllide A dehydrogenase
MEIREVELPSDLRLGYFAGDVECAAICGSDRGMWKSGLKTCVLGHEFTCTVTDPGVTDLNVGERVCMFPGVPCGECPSCKQGRDNLCSVMYRRDFSGISYDGGFAQKYVGPAMYALRIPEGVSSEAAALNEPLATSLHAVRKSGVKIGDKVHVIGVGVIGILCAELAKMAGAALVTVSEFNTGRLETVKERSDFDGYFEATDPALNDKLLETSGGGYDIVFECSGSEGGFATAIKILKPDANIIVVGSSTKPIGIIVQSFLMKETRFVASFGYTFEEFGQALQLIADGAVDPARYITRTVSLEETQDAFSKLFDSPDNVDIKIVVKPNQ